MTDAAGRRNAGARWAVPPAVARRVSRVRLGLPLVLSLGCSEPPGEGARPPAPALQGGASAPADPQCPTQPALREVAPDVAPHHRDPETWLARLPPGEADRVLVDPAAIPGLNARFSEVVGGFRDPLADRVVDPAAVVGELTERTSWIRARVETGTYVETQPGALHEAERVVALATTTDELRMVVGESQLWCVPLTTGLFKPPIDPAFDRNRCASLHPGELVRVLRRVDDPAWVYVHAGHTTGWLQAPPLTPALPVEHVRPLWTGPTLVPLDDEVVTTEGTRVRLGTRVPLRFTDEQGHNVLVAGPEGPVPARIAKDAAVHEGPRPLTRRNLWTMALALQDAPYGWGGTGGARDCSRFLRDLMVSFGFELARNSGVQAKLGTDRVEVGGMSDAAKRQAIAAAARRGIVLLYMPGHIMLYLGEDGGRQYAVSAISDWLEPCKGGPDSEFRIDRVAVTTLELGRDTERTAYIERITTLVVFGPPAAAGAAP